MTHAPTNTARRYIVYCRKSTESEDRQQLSLQAQEQAVRDLAGAHGLTIIGEPIRESRSAKTPGRPLFAAMMDRIRRGEADAILCWHLDRLARNPKDGGELMHELLHGALREIATPSDTYTGDGNDTLMMSILFGMATQYSQSLAANVRRGNRAALEAGRWPGVPPLGYMRDPRTREIVPDPERFDTVKRMWELRILGVPVSEIVEKAQREWALTTRSRGKCSGGVISKSAAYHLFADPFYAGLMRRREGEFIGNHVPMITIDEFRRIEAPPRSVPSNDFLYRGLLRCGACGAAVTAERTVNRWGTEYRHYHCARKSRRYGYCPERSINEEALTEEFVAFIGSLSVPGDIFHAALARIAAVEAKDTNRREREREARAAELARIEQRQHRLRTLLVDGVITEEEYATDRTTLRERQLAIAQEEAATPTSLIEPLEEANSFVNLAETAFRNADRDEKRDIIRRLSSNPVLTNKKLRSEAKFPFSMLLDLG